MRNAWMNISSRSATGVTFASLNGSKAGPVMWLIATWRTIPSHINDARKLSIACRRPPPEISDMWFTIC